MNSIKIQIEDENMVSGLSRRANVHRRTVEAEALEIIRSAIAEDFRFDRLAFANHIAAMSSKNLLQSDSTDFIREDRDRDE